MGRPCSILVLVIFQRRPMPESGWQAETLRNVGNRIVRPIRVNGPDQMGTTIRDWSYVSARRGRRLENCSSGFSRSRDIDQRERAAPVLRQRSINLRTLL